MKATEKPYMLQNFEVIDKTTTRFSSSLRNPLDRIFSLMYKCIETCTLLPKAILLVLDDELIRQARLPYDEQREGFEVILKHLLWEMNRELTKFKETLQKKSKTEIFSALHLDTSSNPQIFQQQSIQTGVC